MSEDLERLSCATYTHARRHPIVIGQIGGWTPPFQLSVPQVGVLLVSYFVEVQTWRYWGGLLPRTVAIVLALALPCALAWAVRSARVEGRSLARAAVGFVMFAWSPRVGQVGGRPYRAARPMHLGAARVYVAAGDDR
jgi:hypothetical protein